MIESLTQANSLTEPFKTAQSPSSKDINQFNQLLNAEPSTGGAIKGLVEAAQLKAAESERKLSGKLQHFNLNDSVRSLVEATHISSMNSISVQLTGKVSTKVSEGFEQIIKQQ